jgi:hypothetical protein
MSINFMSGSSYPNALGHNDGGDEAMPVEGSVLALFLYNFFTELLSESGNMIIMALSYAQKTGDKTHLTQYVIIAARSYLPSVSNMSYRTHFLTNGLSF